MKATTQLPAAIEVPDEATKTAEAPLAPAHGSAKLRMSGENGRIVIINAHAMLRRRYKQIPLWCLVSDLTGHGSGFSAQICRSANLDPLQNCGARQLIDLPPNESSSPATVGEPKGDQ